jgi:hypothetical protein
MAHFAEINDENIVTRILVIANELEENGEHFLSVELGLGGKWIQTSYNARIRKHFAGIGFTYDENLDAFVPPKCHQEAILDETSVLWNCENGEHDELP